MKVDRKAKNQLKKDPIFKNIMTGLKPLNLSKSGNAFNELVKNIVYQQISYKAADKIYARFCLLMGNEKYKPKDLLKHDHDQIKAVGLSNQKTHYVKNIAEFFIEKKLFKNDWSKLSDEEITKLLTEIKGVGEWTVQMILIFELERPDVLPLKDLAIRQAMAEIYKIKKEKKALLEALTQIADHWKPYRTLATLYLWSWKRHQIELKKGKK